MFLSETLLASQSLLTGVCHRKQSANVYLADIIPDPSTTTTANMRMNLSLAVLFAMALGTATASPFDNKLVRAACDCPCMMQCQPDCANADALDPAADGACILACYDSCNCGPTTLCCEDGSSCKGNKCCEKSA